MEGSTERSRIPLASVQGERLNALELKRRGGEMTEAQEAFGAWCLEQGVPFVCADKLQKALAILTGWGALQ